jgi:acyl-coenzyme A thioesterase PaaI-like protein
MLNKLSPKALKFILNLYGPYLGAGVKIRYISRDWKEIRISMKMRWYNRNAVGVHFGGSLYSMVDPHLMLMLMRLLGREHIVWDKAAEIEFVAPGKGEVKATIAISDEELDNIRTKAEDGKAHLPEFEIQILDEKEELVAKVRKILYVRKK